jgi:hypothetical protein
MTDMTLQSLYYRQKASELGRRASLASDDQQKFKLLHEALQWIHLAENEEVLSGEPDLVN